MTEEFLDSVDENNELTGESAPRSKVHTEGIWHQTVHVYVFRKNKSEIEVLVHLRSSFKDLCPNQWDTRVGGHIKSGTTLKDAVSAEIEEEIGIKVSSKQLIDGYWRKHDKFPNKEFSKIFFLEYNDDLDNLKFNDGEVQEVKWMSVKEIKNSIKSNPGKWAGSLDGFTEVSDYLANKIL
jgi:isopentenyl-diphosphate Delta-isomerase